MSLLLLIRILFLCLFLISICQSYQMQNVKVSRNSFFQDQKITEQSMKTTKVRSKMDCIAECKKTLSCLSFSFNDDSKDCYLYDRDFVSATNTLTADEIGWNYYYILPAGTLDKSQCELPTQMTGFCQSYCFFYRNGLLLSTLKDIIKACTDEGGEVIKIDRHLKQFCMELAVEAVIDTEAMVINGMQDEATGQWSHFDGTNMTFFLWDVGQSQPSYVSPIVTPDMYEGIIATKSEFNYLWHDYAD